MKKEKLLAVLCTVALTVGSISAFSFADELEITEQSETAAPEENSSEQPETTEETLNDAEPGPEATTPIEIQDNNMTELSENQVDELSTAENVSDVENGESLDESEQEESYEEGTTITNDVIQVEETSPEDTTKIEKTTNTEGETETEEAASTEATINTEETANSETAEETEETVCNHDWKHVCKIGRDVACVQHYDVYLCRECGEEKREPAGEAEPHQFVFDEEKQVNVCQVCGYIDPTSLTNNIMDAECEHEWESTEIEYARCCHKDGLAKKTCKKCGAVEYETIHSPNEAYGTFWSRPRCTTFGYTYQGCRYGCGTLKLVNTIKPLGHNFVYSEEDGTYVCTRCGETNDSEQLSPLAGSCEDDQHEWKKSTCKNSSCTENGYMTYFCKKCSERKYVKSPLADHSYVNGICEKCGATEPAEEKSEEELVAEEQPIEREVEKVTEETEEQETNDEVKEETALTETEETTELQQPSESTVEKETASAKKNETTYENESISTQDKAKEVEETTNATEQTTETAEDASDTSSPIKTIDNADITEGKTKIETTAETIATETEEKEVDEPETETATSEDSEIQNLESKISSLEEAVENLKKVIEALTEMLAKLLEK